MPLPQKDAFEPTLWLLKSVDVSAFYNSGLPRMRACGFGLVDPLDKTRPNVRDGLFLCQLDDVPGGSSQDPSTHGESSVHQHPKARVCWWRGRCQLFVIGN